MACSSLHLSLTRAAGKSRYFLLEPLFEREQYGGERVKPQDVA